MSTFNELIDFTRSTTGTYLDSVVYGPELVTNGDFVTDSDWIKDSGWTISNGQAQCDGTDGAQFRTIDSPLTNGKTYYISYQITAYTSGDIRVLGQSFYGISSNSVSTVTGIFVATKPYLRFYSSAFNGSIDNVSVKEVIGGQVSGTPLLRTAAINEPRLEYDASGNPLGLLIEEARTNLISTSEALQVASNRAIAESSLSPTGEQTAQTWRVNGSASNNPYWYGNPNIVSGTTYTCSVFVRLPTSVPTVESRYVKLTSQTRMQVGEAVFDLQEGTVVSSNMLSESITPVGNGWYRLSATNTATSSGGSFSFILWPCINAAGDLYVISAGDDGKALLETFGMQTEAGAFPTSYIPTSGSTVTRNKDVTSLPVERFAYNQKKGTVIVNAEYFSTTNNVRFWEISNNTSDNFMAMYKQTPTSIAGYIATSSQQVFLQTVVSSSVIGTNYKLALAFAANNTTSTADGNSVVVDTSSLIPTVTKLHIGQRGHGNQFTLNGHIKSIQYYPKRLSNEELQLLTQPSASPTMNLTFDGQATSTLVEGLHD